MCIRDSVGGEPSSDSKVVRELETGFFDQVRDDAIELRYVRVGRVVEQCDALDLSLIHISNAQTRTKVADIPRASATAGSLPTASRARPKCVCRNHDSPAITMMRIPTTHVSVVCRETPV